MPGDRTDDFFPVQKEYSLIFKDFKFNNITFIWQSKTLQFSLIGSAVESSKEAEDIIWTSSGSDFSDNENKTLIPRLHSKKSLTEKIEKSQSRHDLLLEDRSDEGKFKQKQICQGTF